MLMITFMSVHFNWDLFYYFSINLGLRGTDIPFFVLHVNYHQNEADFDQIPFNFGKITCLPLLTTTFHFCHR